MVFPSGLSAMASTHGRSDSGCEPLTVQHEMSLCPIGYIAIDHARTQCMF